MKFSNLVICFLFLAGLTFAAGDCGYIKSIELVQCLDGKMRVSITTSTPQLINGTQNYVGYNNTLCVLPDDQTMAALVYSSFERALHDHNIHFISIVDANQQAALVSIWGQWPSLVYRYSFYNQ